MPSPLRTLLTVLAGAGLGALLGYFGQCTSGTCPLTANWRRGALYGAFLGLLAVLAGCSRPEVDQEPAPGAVGEVRVTRVHRLTRPLTVPLAGTVRPLERALVAAKVMGTVAQADFTLGQVVSAGETIVALSAAELTARAAQANAALDQARRDVTRESGLASTGAGTTETLRAASDRLRIAEAAAEEARALLGYTRIPAPFAGVITRKLAYAGDLATPGTPLFEIEARDRLRAEIQVPDALPLPAPGSTIPVDTGEAILSGRLVEISPAADPVTHTREARLELPAATALRSGQFVRAAWPAGETAALMLPAAAVGLFGQIERVFVVRDGRAELRLVRTGAREGAETEILSGLNEGESVIVAPPATLRDGEVVRPLP
jgi:membrane fusion protein (multidrug efflux system)